MEIENCHRPGISTTAEWGAPKVEGLQVSKSGYHGYSVLGGVRAMPRLGSASTPCIIGRIRGLGLTPFRTVAASLPPFTSVFLSLFSTLNVSQLPRALQFVGTPQVAHAKLLGSSLCSSLLLHQWRLSLFRASNRASWMVFVMSTICCSNSTISPNLIIHPPERRMAVLQSCEIP